jgi:hypothetical protein
MESSQLKDSEQKVTITPKARSNSPHIVVRELTKANIELIQSDGSSIRASGVLTHSRIDTIMIFSPLKHQLQEEISIKFAFLGQVMSFTAEVISIKDYYRSSTGLIRDFNGLCPNQVIEVKLSFCSDQDRENYRTYF